MHNSTFPLTTPQAGRGRRITLRLGLGNWLTALLLLLTSPVAMAQLSGAYTINSAQPTAGTNYASFTAAVAALNTSGVSGPVTFTVSGGPYTEQVTLNQFTGSSATNRVTFNGGGRTIQFGSSTSAQRAVIALNGADFVTINNLLVDATVGGTSTATYGWGIQVLNDADNVTISNCTVTSSPSSTSTTNFVGIVANGSATSPTTGGNAGSNLTVQNNTFQGGYYGIKIVGNATNVLDNYLVQGNTVQNFHTYGIDADYTSGIQIISNDISRPTRTTVGAFYGVSLGPGTSGAAVEKNRIHRPFASAPTATGVTYGIYLTTGTAATVANSPNYIINNLVYDLDGAGTTYGLNNGASGSARYYHNTVNIDNQTTTGTTDAYGFYHTTGLATEFRNNVVRVTRSGSGTNFALYFSSATGNGIVSNNNDLVVGGTDAQTGNYVSTTYATLTNWRAANNGAYDQNSTDAEPQFVNAATGNLQPTAAPLNNTATPLARVTQDFTGAPRGTTPDMGAYEFAPAASDDVALLSIDSPVTPVTAGSRPVVVTIQNNGGSVLNSVRLEYVFNGGAAVGQTFSGLNLASGATRTLTFTTPVVLLAGSNTLTLTGSLPNGSIDANPSNNTRSTTLLTALSGTFTINKNQPASSTNFVGFGAAATALNAGGISGSVRFNVLNGPYAEQFALGVIPGTSATDTVVIDGGTSKQTLSYSGIISQPAAVQLNGSDYVTLNNLIIDASAGTTYGIGVHLVGQANNNRVSNCEVRGPATATSATANAGIAASGSVTSASTAGDASNLRLENNLISGGYYGVVLTGTSATSRTSGIRVVNNEIRNFYIYGLDVENSTRPQLIGNDIHRLTRTPVTSFYGVYVLGSTGVTVERNRIHDNFTGAPTTSAVTYGIYFSTCDGAVGSENDVVNNLLYNLNGNSTDYAIYNSSSDYSRYYHNTVVLDDATYTGTALSYGFYQTGLATGIELRNNLFSLTRTGTGDRVALAFITATSTISSNYNNLYLGTGSNFITGRYGTAEFASLTTWRAANSNAYDQNSLQTDPIFASAATADYHPTSVLLNGAGTAATLPRVPRDFASVLRSNPPDIGAYELLSVPDDVAVISIDAPTTPALPTANPVTVTIRNNGTTVLSSVTLSYSLNSGPAVSQTFTGLSLAVAANQQLTFTTGVVAPTGTNTLTVTSSLPNGNTDGNPANNSQTITFDQPTPANDEPCNAVALGAGATTSSNSGSGTSQQPGIVTPACSPASAPKDVWFTWTPTGTSGTLYLSGNPAGMVRVFSSPSCSAGPFTQVFCQGSNLSNTSVGAVTVTGLTANQQYYVAVSGFGSSDFTGSFTISTTPLSTRSGINSAALTVFPNPSNTGQLTLRLTALKGAGTVELLNALGQKVLQQPLGAAGELPLSTRGLAPGLYTLRVQVAGQVLTRKVVLQ